ncbi:MAG TPA: VWA domain-containing protein, partial [Vicinamibacterales bacterium]|nr:VWA domain-containing protein [Vicinamibacterales bacterium]
MNGRRSTRHSVLIVTIGLAALAALNPGRRDAVSAQTPQQQVRPPVFRAGANFVYVDAYPRKDGRVVDNLTPEDFEIYEDGVRQTLETFEIVRPPQQTSEVERRDPGTSQEADRQAADPHRRLFVIYLNRYFLTMEAARTMREPLMTFLRRVIGPDDLFGVMTSQITVAQLSFGRRMDVVEQAIDQYWRLVARNFEESDVTPTTPYENMLYGCYINRTGNPDIDKWIVTSLIKRSRLDDVFGGLENLIRHLAALREARSNIMFLSGGFTLAGQNDRLMQYLWRGGPPTIGVDPSGKLRVGSTQPNEVDAQACDRELMRLATVDFKDRLDETLEIAARAHVAFYPIHPAGLSAYDVSVTSAGQRTTPTNAAVEQILDPLRRLALNTDGRAVLLTNDLDTPLREIAADLSLYYLLGYYSTNNKLDGKYRKIEVKLKQPGVDVVARPGYQPPSESDRRAAEGATVAPPARDGDVEAALGRLGRIRPDADVRVIAVNETAVVRVAVEIGRAIAGRPPWSAGSQVSVSLVS